MKKLFITLCLLLPTASLANPRLETYQCLEKVIYSCSAEYSAFYDYRDCVFAGVDVCEIKHPDGRIKVDWVIDEIVDDQTRLQYERQMFPHPHVDHRGRLLRFLDARLRIAHERFVLSKSRQDTDREALRQRYIAERLADNAAVDKAKVIQNLQTPKPR